MEKGRKTNKILTILLIIGTVTVFFPLYMAVIIAFKKPSEMTNDVAGALSLPKSWSFSNFSEAMQVTDFWHSLGNSLLITLVTIVLAILIHSIAGYVIGRGMHKIKGFKFIYFYIVIGKTNSSDGDWKPFWCHCTVSGILYANECAFIQWISEKHPGGNGRSGKY